MKTEWLCWLKLGSTLFGFNHIHTLSSPLLCALPPSCVYFLSYSGEHVQLWPGHGVWFGDIQPDGSAVYRQWCSTKGRIVNTTLSHNHYDLYMLNRLDSAEHRFCNVGNILLPCFLVWMSIQSFECVFYSITVTPHLQTLNFFHLTSV